MKRYMGLAMTVILLAGVSTAMAKSSHSKGRCSHSAIAPPDEEVSGKSYAEWSAEWWKWAMALPADDYHPFWADADHYDVRLGQSGKVWFLPGVFGDDQERDITVPAGKRLFVAIINSEASNIESDPWYGADAAEQLAAAQAFCDSIVDPFCEVDGEALDDIDDYRFASPQFSFTVPNPNILVGDTTESGISSGTSVSDGYWAMIGPLSKGHHTIHFGGSFVGAPFGLDGSIDMTYHVRVK
jgi:hypothetical protein